MLNDCKATVSGYCVKYWATAGITAITGTLDGGRIMVCTNGYYQSYGDKEWDTTLVGATAKAERLRAKKIASLKKQLKKVTEMEIKTP
jgi:hypothetical protein